MTSESALTQVISFTTKKATHEIHASLANSLEARGQSPQLQYLGSGIENPDKIYWILDGALSSYGLPDAEKLLESPVEDSIKNITIAFQRQPLSTILSAPVVEIIHAIAKPSTDLTGFSKIVDYSCKVCEDHPGCLGSAWGFTTENLQEAMLIIGWTSIDAHMSFEKTDICKSSVAPFRTEISSASMFHYKFSEQ